MIMILMSMTMMMMIMTMMILVFVEASTDLIYKNALSFSKSFI